MLLTLLHLCNLWKSPNRLSTWKSGVSKHPDTGSSSEAYVLECRCFQRSVGGSVLAGRTCSDWHACVATVKEPVLWSTRHNFGVKNWSNKSVQKKQCGWFTHWITLNTNNEPPLQQQCSLLTIHTNVAEVLWPIIAWLYTNKAHPP